MSLDLPLLDWNIANVVETDMRKLIGDDDPGPSRYTGNFDVIRQKFGSTTEPTNKLPFQWWADTTTNILKLRNDTNSAWLSIYNFSTQEFILAAGQITAADIDDAARKPSLIDSQVINPSTCNLRTRFTGFTLPMWGYWAGAIVPSIQSTTLTQVYETKIYVGSDVDVLYVNSWLIGVSDFYFKVGSVSSTPTGPVPGSWVEGNIDVGALSGWQTFEAFIKAPSPSPPNTAVIRAMSCRWAPS